jgi:DNA-binding CsgD family transcriptional regulator
MSIQDLTPAERRTLERYIETGSRKVVAYESGRAIQTVDQQLQRARERAGVRTTIQLAIAYGLWQAQLPRTDWHPV